MKKIIFLFAYFLTTLFLFGQNADYFILVKKADSLFKVKEYKSSAFTYSKAFKNTGRKEMPNDRYNAACSWALANYPDSSFSQLKIIATKTNYTNYEHLTTDTNLNSLHNDNRWKPLIETIKQNKVKAEVNLNKPLVAQLDSILSDDQNYRLQSSEIEKKLDSLWKIIDKKDSINLIKVKSILDQYGWLGTDVVGEQGNTTLFLVIQHANQATQEKYLPMMREAVKNGKAHADELALLEDRIAIDQGKKQIYGSQIDKDNETNLYFVLPLEDPDNVDKRRAEVGLEPLAEYVKHWQIKWDVEQYKKDLPKIEALEKAKY